jgi:hypothetical protein
VIIIIIIIIMSVSLLGFNLNRIHDTWNVGKALRTANQGRVTANSGHALSSSFDSGFRHIIIGWFDI